MHHAVTVMAEVSRCFVIVAMKTRGDAQRKSFASGFVILDRGVCPQKILVKFQDEQIKQTNEKSRANRKNQSKPFHPWKS